MEGEGRHSRAVLPPREEGVDTDPQVYKSGRGHLRGLHALPPATAADLPEKKELQWRVSYLPPVSPLCTLQERSGTYFTWLLYVYVPHVSHLADALIQSDLVSVFHFHISSCLSPVGFEPTTMTLQVPGTLYSTFLGYLLYVMWLLTVLYCIWLLTVLYVATYCTFLYLVYTRHVD